MTKKSKEEMFSFLVVTGTCKTSRKQERLTHSSAQLFPKDPTIHYNLLIELPRTVEKPLKPVRVDLVEGDASGKWGDL